MGKCNTVDGNKWRSEVAGQGDGEIAIDQEGTDGKFTGKHKKSTTEKELSGKCRDHSIWFIVPGNKHLYVGGFVNNKRIEGTRFKLDDLCSERRDFVTGGDEDWVATKT